MISSSRHNLPARRTPAGFTLIELLVVIGIILLLVSILVPMVSRAQREATRTRIASDLQVISQALGEYKQLFGDYPRPGLLPGTTTPVGGAQILCWALLGAGPAGDGYGTPVGSDGADGPGFRLRGTQGKIYGPFIQPDVFKVGVPDPATGTVLPHAAGFNDDSQLVFADRYSHPILYFVENKVASVANASQGGYIGQWNYMSPPGGTIPPRYNFNDGAKLLTVLAYPKPSASGTSSSPATTPIVLKRFQWMLGDMNNNNVIDPGMITGTDGGKTIEQALDQPFLLWSAGPDGKFLPDETTGVGQAAVNACDDVTNFR